MGRSVGFVDGQPGVPGRTDYTPHSQGGHPIVCLSEWAEAGKCRLTDPWLRLSGSELRAHA